MDTLTKIQELRYRRAQIENGGGEDKIKQQHDSNKLTARERINLLMDEGSFVETDAFTARRTVESTKPDAQCEGVVTGYGTVDGRLVYVYAQDFTVLGGSLSELHTMKICKVIDMAVKNGAPVVAINDSAGARLEEGIDALAGLGNIIYKNATASGVIPQISVVAGPCVGGAAVCAALTDFIFADEKTSSIYVNGPQVIKGAAGGNIDELGTARFAEEKSGVVHFVSETEQGSLDKVKELLSYLPDNNLSACPVFETGDEINRVSEKLNTIIINDDTEFDVKEVILEVIDNGIFFELQKTYAENMITGFARMNGSTVGIIANQPKKLLDIKCCDKAAKFVTFCDCFNIPVITFTSPEGFEASVEQEAIGIVKHSAKLAYAFAEATVPKINIVLQNAYGTPYLIMNSKHVGADIVYAWPTAQISAIRPDAAATILFNDQISVSDDPIAERQKKVEEYKEMYTTPYEAAKRGYVDDVIEPDSTRPRVISALEMLNSKRENRLPKKHGNLPV